MAKQKDDKIINKTNAMRMLDTKKFHIKHILIRVMNL